MTDAAVPPMPYSADFLAAQRRRLEEEKARVEALIEDESAGLRDWHDGMEGADQHPGDDATATEGMEVDLALIRNARSTLASVEDALHALDRDQYGWDSEAQEWISRERLEALPWARRTIEGQRKIEDRFDYDEDGYTHDADVTSL
jgi:RNA polymerase-binding transcription factor DksA